MCSCVDLNMCGRLFNPEGRWTANPWRVEVTDDTYHIYIMQNGGRWVWLSSEVGTLSGWWPPEQKQWGHFWAQMPQVRWKENQLDTYTKYISPLRMGSSRMIERGAGGGGFWRRRRSIVLFIRCGRNRWMRWCFGEIGAFSVLQLSTAFSSNVIVHFSASDKSIFFSFLPLSSSEVTLPHFWERRRAGIHQNVWRWNKPGLNSNPIKPNLLCYNSGFQWGKNVFDFVIWE